MEQFTGPGWYVVYTRPNAEKRVYDELRRRKITAYMPVQKVAQSPSKGNQREIEIPLFPNYLFVQLSAAHCSTILDIYGATRFVAFGEGPVELDEGVLRCVQELENQYNKEWADSAANPLATVQPGDRVEITAGPLAGRHGTITTFSHQQRARVKVSSTIVDIPFDWLRKQWA